MSKSPTYRYDRVHRGGRARRRNRLVQSAAAIATLLVITAGVLLLR